MRLSGQRGHVGVVVELSHPQGHGVPAPHEGLKPTPPSVRCAPASRRDSGPA
jgi:hypothetical protein